MATINHKKYDEATETFKDFYVYDGKETLIFKVDGEAGKVGIGTSSLSQKLSVASTGITRVLIQNTDNQATGAGIQMLVTNAGTTVGNGTIRIDNTDNMSFFNSGGERMIITSAGNVGIGTSSPQSILHISAAKTTYTDYGVVFRGGTDNNNSHTGISLVSAGDGLGGIIGSNYLHDGSTASQSNSNRSSAYIRFANTTTAGQTSSINIGGFVKGSTSDVTRLFISNTGNVGIGTASPNRTLTVNGDSQFQDIVCSTSIYLGGTAAANALDDYEEGTWTPVLRGAGTSGTYETTILFGNYTKIGNKVSLSARITLDSTITGGGTGYAQVIGLPFTKPSSQQAVGATTFANVTFGALTVQVATEFTTSVNASSTLYFPQVISGASYLDTPISAFTGGQTIEFSITYFV